MPSLPSPLRFVLVVLAGWMNQQQRDVIDYLQEENRALREQIGPRRCGSRTISDVVWRRKPEHSDGTCHGTSARS